MKNVWRSLLILVFAAAPAFAQRAPAPSPAPKGAAPTPAPANAGDAKAKPAAAAPKEPEGPSVNMRLDLTITDQRAEGSAIVKTVSVVTTNGFWGRVRTQGEARLSNGQVLPVILNIDARPTLLRENRVRVELTIEYRPAPGYPYPPPGSPSSDRQPEAAVPNINESLAVVFEDGNSMLISQSADPITDRRVKVDAKLTMLK